MRDEQLGPRVANGVIARPGEGIESLLRRFKKIAQRNGALADARRHESFVPRGSRRRRKSAAARKRRSQ